MLIASIKRSSISFLAFRMSVDRAAEINMQAVIDVQLLKFESQYELHTDVPFLMVRYCPLEDVSLFSTKSTYFLQLIFIFSTWLLTLLCDKLVVRG